MPSLDSLKENLYSFIAKNEHVDLHKLLKWAEEHGTGKLGLFLLLKMLEKEKRITVSELKENIASIKLKDGELKIEIPRAVEAAHVQVHKTTAKRKVATLETILGLESTKKQTTKKVTKTTSKTVTIEKVVQKQPQQSIVQEEKPETRVETETKSQLQAPVQEVQQVVTTQEIQKQTQQTVLGTVSQQIEQKPEVSQPIQQPTPVPSEHVPELKEIVREVIEESRGLPVDESRLEQVVTSILAYLSRYWSVGELRLRLDISKMLSQKLGIDQEVLFEVVGRILKVLKRFDIVEIVEPGVVNLLRRDVCKEFRIKLSEVLGF